MSRHYLFPFMILLGLAAPLFFGTTTQPVKAQPPPPPLQYAAKFICGRSPFRQEPEVVARGTYFTAINVHNPLEQQVEFQTRLSFTRPGQEPSVVRFTSGALRADGTLEIACSDIGKALGVTFNTIAPRGGFQTGDKPRFLTGFVLIESRSELDVVAVYTAEGTGAFSSRTHVESLAVEHVAARRLGQADLIPLPDQNGNFCKRNSTGQLIITIKNNGTVDATASITRLEFATGQTLLVSTPAVPAGTSVDVFATIPGACFAPDCTFRIAADSTALVNESNEGNNAAGGTCRG